MPSPVTRERNIPVFYGAGITVCLLGLFSVLPARGQELIRGRIFDRASGLPLYPATIQNRSQYIDEVSDTLGRFTLPARQGDLLYFRYLGYRPDTVLVDSTDLSHGLRIYLSQVSLELGTLEVRAGMNPYQVDSLERRSLFGYLLERPSLPLLGGSTPKGFGIRFSPFTFFSRSQRFLRHFKKIYRRNESSLRRAYYQHIRIQMAGARYSPCLIRSLTGLQGDSLILFLQEFPPDTDFILHAPDIQIKFYILHRYKEFLGSTPYPAPAGMGKKKPVGIKATGFRLREPIS